MAAVDARQQRREQPLGAVLTREQVGQWLQVRPRQLDRLGIPCLHLGHKTKRYLAEDVQAWLETQRRRYGRAA